MELKQLEAFFWVVQLGSVTAAADKLHTTQPNISQRLKNLERELDVTLFTRDKKRLTLTPRGESILTHARQIVRSAQQLSLEAGNREQRMPMVRIGAADMVCMLWLGQMLQRLTAHYPGMMFEIRTDLTVNLRQQLLDGKLDIAFLAGPVPSNQITYCLLGQMPMQWVVHRSLSPARSWLSPKELAQLPILSHTEGSDLYCLMEEWFAHDGVEPPRFHRCNSLATMIQMASAGLGATVLPPKLLREQARKHELIPLETTRAFPSLSFYAAHSKHLHEPLATALLDCTMQAAGKYLHADKGAVLRRRQHRKATGIDPATAAPNETAVPSKRDLPRETTHAWSTQQPPAANVTDIRN
jgi:DNA-binding transcriptional LysR family regulator